MADDEDEGSFGGLYEGGHWVWDEHTQGLLFVSDLPPTNVETIQITTKAPTGAIEFRDDVDLIEQDVKDLALYTAPVSIMSPMLIDMLHLPTTERFLRALIFYCAYYLQTADEMANRIIELATKVRTQDCEVLENEFKENLSDLRLLVAKEYCIMLIGGGDMRRFHHMGPYKKRRSLSDKDARLLETFLRISVQIVYLALGRRNYLQIELECHRILKSQTFNSVEHTLKTGYLTQMMPEEYRVLLGTCVQRERKLNTRSPLMNEVFCHKPIDFRLMGLGVVKYNNITPRLHYLYLIVAGPEDKMPAANVTLGIIGMRRSLFDTMLRPIIQTVAQPDKLEKSKGSMSSQSGGPPSNKSMSSKKSLQTITRFYPEIRLPVKDPEGESLPSDFPQNPEDVLPINQVQLRRWRNRLIRLTKQASAFN